MHPISRRLGGLKAQEERHLKTVLLDAVEYVLLLASGLLLFTFTATVFLDVVTRMAGHPILWLQEATLGAFVWGTFMGAAVAVRRREHFCVTSIKHSAGHLRRRLTETLNCLVLIVIGIMVTCFGYVNFRQGFGNHLTVTGLPLATLTGAIPVFGLLITIFTTERLALGTRHGFRHEEAVASDETPREEAPDTFAMQGGRFW